VTQLREASDTRGELRRSAQLILHCAASGSRERDADLGRIIGAGVDWEAVLCAASRHSVLPSVYCALIPTFASQLPTSVCDRMRREVHGNALRNSYLTKEAVRLYRLLDKHGMRILVLKGPALAAGVYGDVTLRQFTDLDLLVRKQDLDLACSILADDVYRPQAPERSGAGRWQMTFVPEHGLFEVDLHWRLSPPYFPFTPDGDELWERAVEVQLGAGRVSTLGPDDLILFLCAHGAKHGWQTLSGVCDVERATRNYQYEWEALVARAASLGSVRVLLLGLLLAGDLLGAPIPAALLDAARANPPVQRAARIFRRYFFSLGTDGPGLRQRWSIPMAIFPGKLARLRYALCRAFLLGPRDFDFVRLPSALSPLYYAIRPLRLAWRKSPDLLRVAIPPPASRDLNN